MKAKIFKTVRKMVWMLLALFILSQLCVWTGTGIPWFYSNSTIVQKLSPTLTILKNEHVTEYRDQDWCRVLNYKSGMYWRSENPSTCVLGPDYKPLPSSPFTQSVDKDFAALKNTYFWTGVQICWTNVEYDQMGEISYAVFDMCGWMPVPWYTRYIYSPDKTPMDLGDDGSTDLIEPGWYYQIEDGL